MRLILLTLAPFLRIACVPSYPCLIFCVAPCHRFIPCVARFHRLIFSVASCSRLTSCVASYPLLAFRLTLVLFALCFIDLRYVLPSSYLLRCVLPSSYFLRCVLPSHYLLRCVLPSSSCVALRLTLLRCACRLPFAPLVYRSLFVCVFLSLLSLPVIVRSSICFPYLLSSPPSHIFPTLSHIFPPLSHISFPPVSHFSFPHPYLISPSSPLSHIFPPVSHFSFPLPYFISLSLSRTPYLLPSPLSHIFPPVSHISFPLIPRISFPLIPYSLSPLVSLPIRSHQDGFVVLPGGTSRPRWCNAQECMERPMSVYIRVYTFARPSPASSAVSSLSGVGGPPGRARARILSDCKQSRKEGEQIFIRILFLQKNKRRKSF